MLYPMLKLFHTTPQRRNAYFTQRRNAYFTQRRNAYFTQRRNAYFTQRRNVLAVMQPKRRGVAASRETSVA